MSRESDIAWAAGLFEGEGCITGSAGKHDIHATLQMNDEDPVRRFAEIVGLGSLNPWADKRPGRKQAWRWQTDGDKAESVIRLLLPQLGKRRTGRAIELLARRDAWREHVRRERDCHHCGTAFCPTLANHLAGRARFCSERCRAQANDEAYRRRTGAVPKGTATECRNGHRYTPSNTRVTADGHRNCLTCGRAKSARYSVRRRAAA